MERRPNEGTGTLPGRRRGLIGQHFVPDALARWLRRVAFVWAPTAVVVLLVSTWWRGVPVRGEEGFWEWLAFVGLLAVYLAGWLLALRLTVVGSTTMAVAAVGVGVLASLEHRPEAAFWLTAILFVPAFLLWLVWQRTHHLVSIAAVAAVLVGLLAAGGWSAAAVWDHFYGPVHPESPLEAGPDTPVRWVWTGGVTASSADVVAGVRDPGSPVRVAVARDADLDGARWVQGEATPTDPSVIRASLDGLDPDTTYHAAVEVAGVLDLAKAVEFRTFPTGPASFRFAFGSCAQTGSNGAVFDTIRAIDPLFFLVTGDWFYADIADDDPDAFRDAYDATLAAPAQAALYRSTPVAYVWDDHDYGPNDADRTSAARPAASLVYRERVPHYPFVVAGDDPEGPIAQAFTVGRVRFVLLDGRSARDPDSDRDGTTKTMLGAEQRAWLERELVESARTHALVVLVTNVPWIVPAEDGADHWGGFAVERAWLADVIADGGVTNVLMLAGDAHMVAIDDGTNTAFATGAPGFPLMHAAALDRHGSLKGGPYSEGAYPGAGQFGLVTVEDDGTEVTVQLEGLTWEQQELVAYRFAVPPGPAGS